MKPKVLKNEKEHQLALKKIESLWDAPKGSARSRELKLLVSLVETYDEKHHAISEPNPLMTLMKRQN